MHLNINSKKVSNTESRVLEEYFVPLLIYLFEYQ